MAFDNIEIEIKIEVSQNDYAVAKEKIAGMAQFKRSSHQIDEYFSSGDAGFIGQHPYPWRYLSIRHRGGDPILSYKHFFPEGAEKNDYCEEYETTVADAKAMETIFDKLGLKKVVYVDKKRDVFVYDDTFEVVFDEVRDLGWFIEVEALRDLGGVDGTRQAIMDFIVGLGIADYRVDYRGYPFMAYDRQNEKQAA